MKPALVCTTYDPQGRVLALATPDRLETLRAMFTHVIVVCGLPTTNKAEASLGAHGIEVLRRDCQRLGLYRAALQAGKERAGFLLYVDFDRALHWCATYPDEFRAAVEGLEEAEFTLFGRTQRAFDSHPACQRLTEGPVNDVAHHLFPRQPHADLFGASWGLSRDAALRLITAQLDDDTSFYAAWPALLWRHGLKAAYRATEGLEWETPDAFAGEIASMGLAKWLAAFESPEQWRQRTAMAGDWLRVLIKIAEGKRT